MKGTPTLLPERGRVRLDGLADLHGRVVAEAVALRRAVRGLGFSDHAADDHLQRFRDHLGAMLDAAFAEAEIVERAA